MLTPAVMTCRGYGEVPRGFVVFFLNMLRSPVLVFHVWVKV
ncbi:hypothetical protein HanIR_Chr17g0884241 [Helianthus annuus]|nr:hypothetical protein HanIR_Chr17g0884241 [Helianthus annuus]